MFWTVLHYSVKPTSLYQIVSMETLMQYPVYVSDVADSHCCDTSDNCCHSQ